MKRVHFVLLTIGLVILVALFFYKEAVLNQPRDLETVYSKLQPGDLYEGYWVWLKVTSIEQIDNSWYISGHIANNQNQKILAEFGSDNLTALAAKVNYIEFDSEFPDNLPKWQILGVSEIVGSISPNDYVVAKVFSEVPDIPDCDNRCQTVTNLLQKHLDSNNSLEEQLAKKRWGNTIQIGPITQIAITINSGP